MSDLEEERRKLQAELKFRALHHGRTAVELGLSPEQLLLLEQYVETLKCVGALLFVWSGVRSLSVFPTFLGGLCFCARPPPLAALPLLTPLAAADAPFFIARARPSRPSSTPL